MANDQGKEQSQSRQSDGGEAGSLYRQARCGDQSWTGRCQRCPSVCSIDCPLLTGSVGLAEGLALLTAEKSGKCTICCCQFTSNKLKLKCGHTFHTRCLKKQPSPHEAYSEVACPLCCQKSVNTSHQSVLPPLSTPTQIVDTPLITDTPYLFESS